MTLLRILLPGQALLRIARRLLVLPLVLRSRLLRSRLLRNRRLRRLSGRFRRGGLPRRCRLPGRVVRGAAAAVQAAPAAAELLPAVVGAGRTVPPPAAAAVRCSPCSRSRPVLPFVVTLYVSGALGRLTVTPYPTQWPASPTNRCRRCPGGGYTPRSPPGRQSLAGLYTMKSMLASLAPQPLRACCSAPMLVEGPCPVLTMV